MNHVNDFLLHPRFDALVARFHTKYERRGPDDCGPWTDARRNGKTRYGLLRTGHRGEERWPAHRIAWVLANGPIEPRTLYVCHRCDNPECVNPAHMFLGTHADNIADRGVKKRAARGEAAGLASFTNEQVAGIRRDPRPYSEIAKDYGVTESAIGGVRTGRSWAHLPGAVPEDRARGNKHPCAVLTDDDVRWARQSGIPGSILADEVFGMSRAAIYQMLRGDTWKHVK